MTSAQKEDSKKIEKLINKFKAEKNYQKIKSLGKGGMGEITLVTDNKSQRKVAVKTLKPELINDHEAVIRFTEEAQITAQIEHPNIIPVYEFGLNSANVPYYTMKHIHGTTLKEILGFIRSGNKIIIEKFHLNELLSIFVKVCDAMASACSKNVLHRDLKPENIMVGEFGEVLIVDWGLAKVKEHVEAEDFDEKKYLERLQLFLDENVESIRSINQLDLTLNDCLIGTPQYMAPERVTGEGSEKSEIFSLGVILYDILALQHMFPGNNAKEVIYKITKHNFKPLSEFQNLPHTPGGKVPQALAAVIDKATSQNPSDRYSSINQLKNEIESYIHGFATQAERAGFFKLLKLGIKRNRKLSLLITACFIGLIVLSTFFIFDLQRERYEAQNTLFLAETLKEEARKKELQATEEDQNLKIKISQLKQQGPVLFENARYELNNLDFAKALRSIDYAVDLEPNQPYYHFLRGRIQLSLLWLEEAVESFKMAARSPEVAKDAKEFEQMALQLSALLKEGNLPNDNLIGLFNFFLEKGNTAEAIAVLNELKDYNDYDKLLEKCWLQRLSGYGLQSLLTGEDNSYSIIRGKFDLTIQNMSIYDLSVLKGMPFNSLVIKKCPVSSIEFLRGSEISSLNLFRTRVSDLSPLKNLELTKLILRYSEVKNLEALQTMSTLREINISNTRVVDLTPLHNIQLNKFYASNSLVNSLQALENAPLSVLIASSTPINNIEILAGKPLRIVDISNTAVKDITPLAQCQNLVKINLDNTLIKTLEPLKNLELIQVSASNTAVRSVLPLKDQPIESLNLSGTQVSNLSGLSSGHLRILKVSETFLKQIPPDLKNLETLEIANCDIKNLKPLKSFIHLRELNIDNTPVLSLWNIAGLRLEKLHIGNNRYIKDVRPFAKMALKDLAVNKTAIKDLSSINVENLEHLNIAGTDISSLDFLKGIKLKTLNIYQSKVTSLEPVKDMESLVEINTHRTMPDMKTLKQMKQLKFIRTNTAKMRAGDFWQTFRRKP